MSNHYLTVQYFQTTLNSLMIQVKKISGNQMQITKATQMNLKSYKTHELILSNF